MPLIAVEPLFIDDLDDLKAELRLTGANERDDVESIIRRGVLDFRVGFAHRAGLSILTGLQAIPFTADPQTEDDYRRAGARLLEVKHVWRFLLQQLRSMFADASGSAFQQFNDEGVWRQLDSDDVRTLLMQCNAQIEELYQLVLGIEALGEDSEIHVFDGTTDRQDLFFPGGTVFPHVGKFPGNFIVPTLSLTFDNEIDALHRVERLED